MDCTFRLVHVARRCMRRSVILPGAALMLTLKTTSMALRHRVLRACAMAGRCAVLEVSVRGA
eukprot:2083899-Alexandrium_andersonii.AAC.1